MRPALCIVIPVLDAARARSRAQCLQVREFETLRDVDLPADLPGLDAPDLEARA